MKIFSKIIIVSLILIFVLPYMCVYGTDWGGDLSAFKRSGQGNTKDFLDMAGRIAGAVTVIGSVVSLITLIIIGIKYMVGSVDERADYKKTMLPWLLGAVMVFVITLLPSLIYTITKDANL